MRLSVRRPAPARRRSGRPGQPGTRASLGHRTKACRPSVWSLRWTQASLPHRASSGCHRSLLGMASRLGARHGPGHDRNSLSGAHGARSRAYYRSIWSQSTTLPSGFNRTSRTRARERPRRPPSRGAHVRRGPGGGRGLRTLAEICAPERLRTCPWVARRPRRPEESWGFRRHGAKILEKIARCARPGMIISTIFHRQS